MDTVQARIERHRLEDLHRLAAKAEQGGSRILHVAGTSNHVATSATSPIAYAVTVNGCTCRGFQAWGRCGHWALLLSELGRLPDLELDVVLDDEPAPAVTAVVVEPAPCRTCRGEGFVRAYVGGGLNDWTAVPCTCTHQHAA